MVVPEKTGFGCRIGDREAWAAAVARHHLQPHVATAEGLLAAAMEPFARELFLEFSANGNRSRWERQNGRRVTRLQILAMAECIENKGRFLPALEKAIESFCADPTWLLSACDTDLANLRGQRIDIDLGAAMRSEERRVGKECKSRVSPYN